MTQRETEAVFLVGRHHPPIQLTKQFKFVWRETPAKSFLGVGD
jgi:hypothetical protein